MQATASTVNYVNNVVTGRAPNTYSPYDAHGNVYSYYNSSYDTGKIPTPDAPRIEDVDAASVYYCEKGKEKRTYDRDAAVAYASIWAGNTNTVVSSNSTLNYIWDYIVNAKERNPDYYNYGSNCANFVSQSLVAGGLKMTEEWHQEREFNLTKHLLDIKSALPVVGRNYWYDWDSTSAWSEANAQYEYFSKQYGHIEIKNKYSLTNNEQIIEEVLQNNNVQKGDLLYFQEYDDDGNAVVTHATIISSVHSHDILYAGNTVSRYEYSLTSSLSSPDYIGVYIVTIQ